MKVPSFPEHSQLQEPWNSIQDVTPFSHKKSEYQKAYVSVLWIKNKITKDNEQDISYETMSMNNQIKDQSLFWNKLKTGQNYDKQTR